MDRHALGLAVGRHVDHRDEVRVVDVALELFMAGNAVHRRLKALADLLRSALVGLLRLERIVFEAGTGRVLLDEFVVLTELLFRQLQFVHGFDQLHRDRPFCPMWALVSV